MADCVREKIAGQEAEVDFRAFKEPLRKLALALEKVAETEGTSERVRNEVRKLLAEADAIVERLPDVKAAAIAGRSSLEHSIRAQPWLAVGLAAVTGFVVAAILRRSSS
jgi:ElaB/YqjD/DUF883 family membrane-anchored ribosome-binding protein